MNSARNIKRKHNPRQNANPFSAATFCYTLPTFIKGSKKPFEEDDLYQTLGEHQSETLANRVETLWKNQEKPSLAKALMSTFAFEYIALGLVLGTSELVLKPAQAVFLGRLLLYYMPTAFVELRITLFEARIYACGIALMSFLYVLIFHPLMTSLHLVGLKAKIACSSLIYRKALKLNNAAFNSTSVGQIVNLVSTDAPMFIVCAFLLHYLWIAPVQCIIVTYLMYQEVGFSSIVGVLLLFLLIPTHHLLGKVASKYRWKAASRTDDRVCYMDEIILGIKAIKIYAWEKLIKGALASLRNLEVKYIRFSMYLKAANISFDALTIPIVIYVTMIVYLSHDEIRADKVFTLMVFYNSLRGSIASVFPQSIAYRALTLVAIKRIEEFLNRPEIEMESIEGTTDLIAVRIVEGYAKWNENLTLHNVNLTVKPGTLVAVVGKVGSGKSSLLNVVLKELRLVSGKIHVNGQISYASQDAWLFSGSIRDNILFSEKTDTKRYDDVVRVCALEDDFGLFPMGDQTIVGGRGASLSGGQKARISLARAVYRDADIYLLDEPFAAVDHRVGKRIFQQCIKEFLGRKTVVLVTHQLSYLKDVDEVIVMSNGTVVSQGPFSENNNVLNCAKDQSNLNDEIVKQPRLVGGEVDITEDTNKEQTSVGSVSTTVYRKYLAASGFLNLMLVGLLFVFAQVLVSSAPYFLTHWVNMAQTVQKFANVSNSSEATPYETYSKTVYIHIYSTLTFACFVIVSLRSYLSFSLLLNSSQKLHNNMFNNLIGGTMHFFNTNSQGRILNRFSQDMAAVDTQLPNIVIDTTQLLLGALASVLLVVIANWWLIIPTLIIGIISYYLKSFCLLTARNIKRLEGVTRSPVFEHLSSSLQGLSTIRAFQAEAKLREEFDSYQDLHSCCYHLFLTTSQGFGYFLDSLCSLYIAAVTLSFVIFDNEALSGDVGLAITQSISLIGYLEWAVLQTAELENSITSVERILEYDSIEQEDKSGTEPRKSWPETGGIVFRDVSLQYSRRGAPVLKNVSFEISPTEKIGVIGRTGAGKSSIVNALLRLSYTSGTILIDNLDIKGVNLQALRSKISVIPQDPTLLSGTLRKNLDPFDEINDGAIWNALDEVNLKQFIASKPQGLCYPITQSGANLSVGQRQLICLARVILHNSKILIMDEATANIDLETDNLIQKTIREKFKNCTILTIAHRLQTVLDYDRVLVMKAGEVVEFDNPSALLKNSNGYFYKILQTLQKPDATS
ncbi:probable multidrug resistance-associated protein lethal(2)03659 isoform X1 [Photinus pyralis]|uniref:probable multidrug resistance-associated protein lethal(2)03659 isoform X1 n=1 Tax=Photinus pyralis TaxID=7054 RepID=UPI00126704BA|nr:probable multidrug resistance-associated protein lethal(2)03659 isoform X1 [Photinus pyralis]XP_031344384.1 probable multidrug resistance-associated protein lethal(2)03659 isoform X1 [Photinus pyralis]